MVKRGSSISTACTCCWKPSPESVGSLPRGARADSCSSAVILIARCCQAVFSIACTTAHVTLRLACPWIGADRYTPTLPRRPRKSRTGQFVRQKSLHGGVGDTHLRHSHRHDGRERPFGPCA